MQTIEHIRATSDQRFQEMYEALAQEGFGPLDAEVARALKFRPQAIRKLPIAQRARKARQILLASKNAELAYEFIGSYLLKQRRELVLGFLDATGVAHEDGMVQDIEGEQPDAAKIEATVAELDGKFEKEDVTAYLAIAAQQWPGVAKLGELWRKRSGSAAGSTAR